MGPIGRHGPTRKRHGGLGETAVAQMGRERSAPCGVAMVVVVALALLTSSASTVDGGKGLVVPAGL